MAHTNRYAAATVVLVASIAVVGTGLLAGPALAQETTEETMDGGNESMDDGMTTDDGMMTEDDVGDDGMTTEDSMDEGETMSGDGMTTDGMDDGESMDDDVTTDGGETMMDGEEETVVDDGETASDGQPGFGLVVGLLALLAAAAFALHRRSG